MQPQSVLLLVAASTAAMAAAVVGGPLTRVFEFDMKYYEFYERFIQRGPTPNKVQNLRSFEWKSCSPTPSKDAVVLHNITIQPDPIRTPGSIFWSANVTIQKELKSPIKVDSLWEVKVGPEQWQKIQCFGHMIGSCSTDDVCEYLKSLCPTGLSCSCPFEPGSIFFPRTEYYVGKTFIFHGDLRLRVNASYQGQSVGCYQFSFNINNTLSVQ